MAVDPRIGYITKRNGKFYLVMTPTYRTWAEMKTRCYNKKRPEYPRYGGRGIKVCDSWLHSFTNFFADMGVKPKGFSIDRVDNDGNYEPRNCRWATRLQQARNMRSTIKDDLTTSPLTGVQRRRIRLLRKGLCPVCGSQPFMSDNTECYDCRKRRGVKRPGSTRHHRKLTTAEVLYIRRKKHQYSVSSLARRFDLSWQTMKNILMGRTWKHLPLEP